MASLAAWLVMSLAVPAVAATAPATTSSSDLYGSGDDVSVLQVRPNFYMLTVDGVNVGLETGSEGPVVVDTGPQSASSALLQTIQRLSPKPIGFIINTSADPDLTGGNPRLVAAGLSPIVGNLILNQYNNDEIRLKNQLGPAVAGAPIIARQGVVEQMILDAGNAQVPALALPTQTFDRPEFNFRINGDIINVVAMPPAHSDADSAVLFRRADVVVTGAIFDIAHFPVIDLAHGGSIDGEIAAINEVMNSLAVPTTLGSETDNTLVIPVHGQLCDQADLVTYRDMLAAVRQRVADQIAHHASLAQVEAADLTQGYDQRFGSSTGPWTTRDFVEAVYKSLMAATAHGRGKG